MEKRIYRSNTEKMVAGVAGGIAEYFEVDPVLVRVAFVITAFFSGVGVIAYIACIFIIPKAPIVPGAAFGEVPGGEAPVQDAPQFTTTAVQERKEGRHKIFGWILVILGASFLLKNYFCFFDFENILPFLLILAGIWIVTFHKRRGAVSNDLR